MTSASVPHSDIRHLAEMIKGIKVAMFATVTSDGSIHSRPMLAQHMIPPEFDGRLWFFIKEDSAILDELEAHNFVNLTYAKSEQEHYVSVSGRASTSRDEKLIRELWNPALESWFTGVEDPSILLLCVEVERAQIWDGPASKFDQFFEMARSFFQGKSIDKKGSTHEMDFGRIQ